MLCTLMIMLHISFFANLHFKLSKDIYFFICIWKSQSQNSIYPGRWIATKQQLRCNEQTGWEERNKGELGEESEGSWKSLLTRARSVGVWYGGDLWWGLASTPASCTHRLTCEAPGPAAQPRHRAGVWAHLLWLQAARLLSPSMHRAITLQEINYHSQHTANRLRRRWWVGLAQAHGALHRLKHVPVYHRATATASIPAGN